MSSTQPPSHPRFSPLSSSSHTLRPPTQPPTLLALVLQPVLELRRDIAAQQVRRHYQHAPPRLLRFRGGRCCCGSSAGLGVGGGCGGGFGARLQQAKLGGGVAAQEGEGAVKAVQLNLRMWGKRAHTHTHMHMRINQKVGEVAMDAV